MLRINEYLISKNEFETPKELKDRAAVCIWLIRLLLLTPGSIQSHPNMGVGLRSKWRYVNMDKLDSLESEIQKQIMTYLPKFKLVEVSVQQQSSNTISILINIDKATYAFNNTEQGLEPLNLSDL